MDVLANPVKLRDKLDFQHEFGTWFANKRHGLWFFYRETSEYRNGLRHGKTSTEI